MSEAESIVEVAALAWRGSLGDTVLHCPDIAAGEPAAERQVYGRLRDTLLPKLISSELREKDAARFMEFAA